MANDDAIANLKIGFFAFFQKQRVRVSKLVLEVCSPPGISGTKMFPTKMLKLEFTKVVHNWDSLHAQG